MVLLLREEILYVIQQLISSLYINTIIPVPGVSASSKEQHPVRAYSSILSTGHLHFLCSVLLQCWPVSLKGQNLKSHNSNHDYFSQRLQLNGINMTWKDSNGFHFCLKDSNVSCGSSACSFASAQGRKLNSLFKQAIPSSKSLNSVCQENKNIHFTEKLFPKHTEEPVIKKKINF